MNGKQSVQLEGFFSRGIFAALPEEEWKTLSGFQVPVTLDRKTPVFDEGDRAAYVYLVRSGLVKTFKTSHHDRTQILNIASAGEILGVEALTQAFYQKSATALTRTVVSRISKEHFLDFMNQTPALSNALVQIMTAELNRIQMLIVDLGTKKAIARVSSCILLFMEKQLGGGPIEPFTLPISRQEMGSFLGLSPETVSRQLKTLMSRKLVRLDHKRCTILNIDQLRALADST